MLTDIPIFQEVEICILYETFHVKHWELILFYKNIICANIL